MNQIQEKKQTVIAHSAKFFELYIDHFSMRKIEQHLEATYPNEGCGFFLGKENQDGSRTINEVYPVENAREGDQRRRFEIHPIDYLRVEKYAEKSGKVLLGIYHSHPDHPAIPSGYDLKVALPFFSYVILSIENGRTKRWSSWRLNDQENLFQKEIVIL